VFKAMRGAVALALSVLGLLAGCSTAQYPVNSPLAKFDPETGYRMKRFAGALGDEELFVVLTFSGGGTRAAALAYGVLEELSRTPIFWRGARKRLLDEVDLVYGVSGGSITAAYWGLHGDRIFADFDDAFLGRDFESQLLDAAIRLPNLWRVTSPRFGRGDLLQERLDAQLFHGATFADLAARRGGPLVVISATDLSNGARIDFTQDYFDLICSDLSSFPVARAVAASSAVPVVFSPITLWNYAGSCGYIPSPLLASAREAPSVRRLSESREEERARSVVKYLDRGANPYLHLVDGGLADNLAVRGLLELAELSERGDPMAAAGRPLRLRKLLFITVDAGVETKRQISMAPNTPSVADVIQALADIPVDRFSAETRLLLRAAFEKWRSQPVPSDPHGEMPQIFTAEVSLRSVPDEGQRSLLMLLPTSLSLPGDDVRKLRAAGARLLRESTDFQRLVRQLSVGPAGGTPSP
jgi:NTE family protein